MNPAGDAVVEARQLTKHLGAVVAASVRQLLDRFDLDPTGASAGLDQSTRRVEPPEQA